MAFASRIISFDILKKCFTTAARRNMGVLSVVLSKLNEATDPVQELFLIKLSEYQEKCGGVGGGELFDISTEITEERNLMIGNGHKRYGTEEEMNQLPKFSWDPDDISQSLIKSPRDFT